MNYWEPIKGIFEELKEEGVVISGTTYKLSDSAREILKKIDLKETVNVMRNKEGVVTLVSRVSHNAKDIMDEANKAAQAPQKLILSSKDKVIIRQNCLAHADAWLKVRYDDIQANTEFNTTSFAHLEEEYFRFAKECEQWITR